MSLKKKIKSGQLTIGSWITIGHPTIAEVMAKAGFDWLAIDMEHGPVNFAQCQELIRTVDLCEIPALVRVGANDPLLIKQAMDAGAQGVIVPMVNSKKDAEKAVTSVKYPPEGKRGVGLTRASDYGTKFDEYKKWVRDESIVIVQIEHIEAAKNIKEILNTKGVDAFIIGPYDLSGSMGIPGAFKDPGLLSVIEEILNAAKLMKVTAGFHSIPTDLKFVKEKIKQGFQLIAYSVDFLLLGDQCRNGLKFLKHRK